MNWIGPKKRCRGKILRVLSQKSMPKTCAADEMCYRNAILVWFVMPSLQVSPFLFWWPEPGFSIELLC